MPNAINTGVDRSPNRLVNPAFRRFFTTPSAEPIGGSNRSKSVFLNTVGTRILIDETSESLAGFFIEATRAKITISPRELDGAPVFPPYGQALLIEAIEGTEIILRQPMDEPGPLIGSRVSLSLATRAANGDLGWRQGVRNSKGDEITAEELHSSHDATFLQHVRALDIPVAWTDLEWFVRFTGDGSMYVAAPIVVLGDYERPRFSDEFDQPQRTIVLSLGDKCPTGFRERCEVENSNLQGIVGDPNVILDVINVTDGDSVHNHGGLTGSANIGASAKKRSSPRVWTHLHQHPVEDGDQTPPSITIRVCERI